MLDFVRTSPDTGARTDLLKHDAGEEMRKEHDPLASHIFISRRLYQAKSDTKSGKRHHLSARLSWQQACDLGFRMNLEEWERLMDATPKR